MRSSVLVIFVVACLFLSHDVFIPNSYVVAAEKDLYAVLGLPKDTSHRAIRKAFRKLSMKYHPDKNPGNKEAHDKFVEITAAYDILGDEEKRRRYDLYGDTGDGQGQQQQRDPFDIFSSFFGGGGSFFGGGGGHHHHAQERRGPPIHIDLDVTLADLYNGAEMDVDISRYHLCPRCRGSGAASAEAVETCTVCGGTGVKIVRQMLAPGMYTQMQTTCEACGGKGKIISATCPVCSGKKVVRGSRKITVVVERGMRDGEEIVFEGAGDEGPDQGAGDLVFRVRQLERHPIFSRRQGDHLMMESTISLMEALVGFERNITHLDGRIVTIARTQVTPSGFVQEIVGEGMPRHTVPSERGSLYVKYTVLFPKTLTETEKSQVQDIFKNVSQEPADMTDAATGKIVWDEPEKPKQHWTEEEHGGAGGGFFSFHTGHDEF